MTVAAFRFLFALLLGSVSLSCGSSLPKPDAGPAMTELRLSGPPSNRAAVPTTLSARIAFPVGAGPFALAILNHGAPRTPEERAKPASYPSASRWFLERGLAVMIVDRRGYGSSTPPFAEGFGSCDDPDYARAGRATAADILAAVRYARQRPDIAPRKIVLVGQSAGGWGVLAAAAASPEGVRGLVNLAGGRGSTSDGRNCRSERLVEAAAAFGRDARLPALWVYAQNDELFGPALARRMFDAYHGSARFRASFVLLPPVGQKGHALLGRAIAVARWGPAVEAFLRDVGILDAPTD